MRTTEIWCVTCLCGAEIESPTPEFRCPACGRRGLIERPDEPVETCETDRTISAKEGLT